MQETAYSEPNNYKDIIMGTPVFSGVPFISYLCIRNAAVKRNRACFPDVISSSVPVCAPLPGPYGWRGGYCPGKLHGPLAAGDAGKPCQGVVVCGRPEPVHRCAEALRPDGNPSLRRGRPRLRSEREARLWAAVDALPEMRRRCLLMAKRDGLSYKEIAQDLGLSENTVRNHISRALETLREEGPQILNAVFLFF